MKILIDNSGYELLNYGDTAMLQTAVTRFAKCFPGAEIHVFTTSPENLAKFCPGTIPVDKTLTLNGRLVWKMMWNVFGCMHRFLPGSALKYQLALFEFKLLALHSYQLRPWINWRLKRRNKDTDAMNRVLDLISSADIVIATGGGYLTDAFELHARRVLMTLTIAHAQGKPTALFGQGIGPIEHRFLADIVRFCLPKMDLICLREASEGPGLLRKYKVPESKVSVTGDDAIESVYLHRAQKLGADIGINLRIAYYSKVNENLVKVLKPILLDAKTKYKAGLRAIPISDYKKESDKKSIQRIFGDILDNDGENIASPLDVITEVGQCKVVITGSYHAGVFALSQGASAVCLASSEYYKHKFQGLAAQFGYGCYIVMIEGENFAKDFENALEEAWLNAGSVREDLLASARKQISKSNEAYGIFANNALMRLGKTN